MIRTALLPFVALLVLGLPARSAAPEGAGAAAKTVPVPGPGPGPLHATYAAVLEVVVADGQVDYRRLKADPAGLDAYLAELAAVPAADFARWPRDERLALLLNLYNARTLRLIVEHYPVTSIRRIGLVPGSAWKRDIVRFGGATFSLDHLEHGILRPGYAEPRIHFALVCAARSCPPLREEPFVAARLEAQLEDQGRRFFADPAKNRFEETTGTLWLSPIFDWFGADFTAGGRPLAAFVTPYLPATARERLALCPQPRLRFTDYDWSLNERSAR